MLRALVIILVIVNATFWGWAHGWFGAPPLAENREPQRLASQVHPELVRVISATAENAGNPASTALDTAGTAATPALCLESGPLDNSQTEVLKRLVAAILPEDFWELGVQTQPSSWAVYIGPFNTETQAAERKAALARRNVVSEIIRNRAQYQPGLTLGVFQDRVNADRQLSLVQSSDVTDARIVPWTVNPVGQRLRISQASPAIMEQLRAATTQARAPAFEPCSDSGSPVSSDASPAASNTANSLSN